MAEPRDECHHLFVNGKKPRHELCLVKRINWHMFLVATETVAVLCNVWSYNALSG